MLSLARTHCTTQSPAVALSETMIFVSLMLSTRHPLCRQSPVPCASACTQVPTEPKYRWRSSRAQVWSQLCSQPRGTQVPAMYHHSAAPADTALSVSPSPPGLPVPSVGPRVEDLIWSARGRLSSRAAVRSATGRQFVRIELWPDSAAIALLADRFQVASSAARRWRARRALGRTIGAVAEVWVLCMGQSARSTWEALTRSRSCPDATRTGSGSPPCCDTLTASVSCRL